MRSVARASFASFAVLLLLSGCDSSSPEDGAENFSLDALEVSVSNEMSDSPGASVEASATTIEYTIKITNSNATEATNVAAVVNLYAHEVNSDGSCEYCGTQIGSGSGGAETVAAGETITERGSIGLGGDFDGELWL
jgi:hypothetical protein